MGAASEKDLSLFRLRAQLSLLETLFLKLWILKVEKRSDHLNATAIQGELLRELEQQDRMSKKVYFSDEQLSYLNEHQRAVLVEEHGEMVEALKAFVEGLTDG